MPITEELTKLGNTVRRLNDGADELVREIQAIEATLRDLALPFDYLHPRPLEETARVGPGGKRVIEVVYLGVMPCRGRRRLAIKMVKILESKAAVASQSGGAVMPLLDAPRGLLHAAAELLGEVVRGIGKQLDELAEQVDRRRSAAREAQDALSRSSASASGVRRRLGEDG